MKIEEILIEENIILSLSATTKNETIEIMAQMLFLNNKISDLKKFIDDVNKREKLGFTGVGKGIAIPHGISEEVKVITIAIAKLKEEIDWDSTDKVCEKDRKVKFIILFAVPKEDLGRKERKHIEALKTIMTKLADNEVMEELLISKDKKKIIEILSANDE